MASSKFVAEYAKSNRTTCKICMEAIAAYELRLGLVVKNSVGFNRKNWHHLECFPLDTEPIDSVENIDGFSSLETSDQERLKDFTDKRKEQDGIEGSDEKSSKKSKGSNSKKPKVSKADEVTVNGLEGGNSNKSKNEIKGSDKKSSKFVAEYAKSNRSTCKICMEAIAAKELRLGLVVNNSVGFNKKKWHHLECFPLDTEPIDSVENIDGFSSLETSDQERLKDFTDKRKEQDEIEGSDEKSSKESKVLKADEVAVDEVEGSNSKKPKNNDQEALKNLIAGCGHFPKEFVAEYAKSNRSTSKIFMEAIAAKELRLGLVVNNSVGFNKKNWHHLECFPLDTEPIESLENIDGFSSLEASDQEWLKDLTAGCNVLPKEVGKDNEIAGNELGKAKEVKPELDYFVSVVKNKYKDASLLPGWKAFKSIMFLEQDQCLFGSAKIAAFGFEGCLLDTLKSVGPTGGVPLYPSIPKKLKGLCADGYKLVIFTNEPDIEGWKNKRQFAVHSILGRVNNFTYNIEVPIQVFVACGSEETDSQTEDHFWKPKPGMWKLMEQQFNFGIKIDVDKSFYVGNAAGRANDPSDEDKEFAKAIGLNFFVPEEYFGT